MKAEPGSRWWCPVRLASFTVVDACAHPTCGADAGRIIRWDDPKTAPYARDGMVSVHSVLARAVAIAETLP